MTTAGVLLIVGVYVVLLIVYVALGKAAALGDELIAATREREGER